jgi:hypothetical protein
VEEKKELGKGVRMGVSNVESKKETEVERKKANKGEMQAGILEGRG